MAVFAAASAAICAANGVDLREPLKPTAVSYTHLDVYKRQATYCVIVPFMLWAVAGKRPTFANVGAAALCITGIGLV